MHINKWKCDYCGTDIPTPVFASIEMKPEGHGLSNRVVDGMLFKDLHLDLCCNCANKMAAVLKKEVTIDDRWGLSDYNARFDY